MPGSNSRPNVSEGYEVPTELPGSTGLPMQRFGERLKTVSKRSFSALREREIATTYSSRLTIRQQREVCARRDGLHGLQNKIITPCEEIGPFCTAALLIDSSHVTLHSGMLSIEGSTTLGRVFYIWATIITPTATRNARFEPRLSHHRVPLAHGTTHLPAGAIATIRREGGNFDLSNASVCASRESQPGAPSAPSWIFPDPARSREKSRTPKQNSGTPQKHQQRVDGRGASSSVHVLAVQYLRYPTENFSQ